MFILWTKQEFDGKYILFAKNTLKELKKEFKKFCKLNEDTYEINKELKEEELNSFSKYDKDDNFYYCEIKDVSANFVLNDIYILIFNEDGEGGRYHNELYFRFSNSRDALLEIATDFFMEESEKTKEEDINEMLEELNKTGEYQIPYSRSWCCDMIIFKFIRWSQ